MSDWVSVPLKVAVSAPILTSTAPRMAVGEVRSSERHPGMHGRTIIGSFNAAHTRARGVGMKCSPDMSIEPQLPRVGAVARLPGAGEHWHGGGQNSKRVGFRPGRS